jgi:type I restriction enzyme S subunit
MMIDNTTYKNTSIGLIPSDWEIKRLGSLGKTFTGLSGKNKDDFGEGFQYIPYKNIFQNSIIDISFMDLVKIKPNETQSKVKYGDLFFTTSSETAEEVGMCSVLLEEVENMYLNSFCFGFRFDDFEILDPKFSSYLFRGEQIRQEIIVLAQGSTRFNLSKSELQKLKIPIPPLKEQQKIASILSIWDRAIDNCKEIVEGFKLRNKGLSQQLLTGKMRVKGFEKANWSLVPIKKISKDSSKKNPSNKELIVLSCTKHKGLVPSLEYFGRKIYSEDLTTYKIVSKGQFAYATNHIEEGSIGYQSKYDEALISPMYTVFQTDETVNDNFLFRILKSTNYIHEYQKRMEGSIDRRGGLRWDEFSKIKVPVPDLKEQLAIVEILDKATEELNQYQQKLETLQLQKKGLMQQLLTGKVRVKTNN